jgi:hypothetical protein
MPGGNISGEYIKTSCERRTVVRQDFRDTNTSRIRCKCIGRQNRETNPLLIAK